MQLKSLLSEQNDKIRNDNIKRAFAPYTPSIAVDGDEFICLCILINLSNKQCVLTDVDLAISLIKTNGEFESLLEQIQWLQRWTPLFGQ